MKIQFLISSFLFVVPSFLFAQSGNTAFDHFELKDKDVVWQHTYQYVGSVDSVRQAVVLMLRSKHFTTNVIRNEGGYFGEIKNYKVDCEKYNRKYTNTPFMYWYGIWTGKFAVQVKAGEYRVTVYGLYYEKPMKERGNYHSEKWIRGLYLDAVTDKKKGRFLERELRNLSLMSLSLYDDFDIRNTKDPLK